MTGPAEPAQSPIVVVYGVDDRFAIPLAASIRSTLDHLGARYRLDIHIIDGGLSRRNQRAIEDSFRGEQCRLVWQRPDRSGMASLKVGGAITIATYYRLLIPELLPTEAKAIYLDADLIVQADLGDLWSLPIGDRHLLAVQDQGVRLVAGPYGLTNYRQLRIPAEAKYFNAGVLVLNLQKWRQHNTATRILSYVRENPEHIRFHDQDGLNAILWDQWSELDPRWNQMPQILQAAGPADSPFDAETFKRVTTGPYIIHYASADKPWRFGCKHPAKGKFFRNVDRTAYKSYRPSRWGTRWDDSVDLFRKRIVKVYARLRALVGA